MHWHSGGVSFGWLVSNVSAVGVVDHEEGLYSRVR